MLCVPAELLHAHATLFLSHYLGKHVSTSDLNFTDIGCTLVAQVMGFPP